MSFKSVPFVLLFSLSFSLLFPQFSFAWEGSVYRGRDVSGNFDCKVQILKREKSTLEILFSTIRTSDGVLINIERMILDEVDRRSLLNIGFEQRVTMPTYNSRTHRIEASRVSNISLIDRKPGIPNSISFESYYVYSAIPIQKSAGTDQQEIFESMNIYSCPALNLQSN